MRANHFRDAALAATSRGWAVFPLRPNSKVAAIKRWEQRSTTDETEIHQWWPHYSRNNVGIACGPSGLVVLDLDAAHGDTPPPEWDGAAHGSDVLHRVAAEAGQSFPVGTYTVRTPTGGLHLYFQAPQHLELRNTAGRLGWRIDTRGRGGYIIAAGSVRPNGRYEAMNRAAIMPLPGWLVTALTPTPPATSPRRDLPVGRAAPYVQAIVTSETDRIRRAARGERHHVLLRAAYALGRLVGAGELGDADARIELHAAAATHVGNHGFSAEEAERTIADGLAYGIARPRYITHHDD